MKPTITQQIIDGINKLQERRDVVLWAIPAAMAVGALVPMWAGLVMAAVVAVALVKVLD